MEPKKKRGRPKKVNPILQQVAKDIEFVKPVIFDAEKLDGRLVIDDPIQAAALARAPFCKGHEDEVPFPSDWDTMGKIDRLKWLKERQK